MNSRDRFKQAALELIGHPVVSKHSVDLTVYQVKAISHKGGRLRASVFPAGTEMFTLKTKRYRLALAREVAKAIAARIAQ